jgi:hypothetical protein
MMRDKTAMQTTDTYNVVDVSTAVAIYITLTGRHLY